MRLLTTRVSAGRPLIVAQAADAGSGVDPLSLVFSYGGVLIGASAYDPLTGIVVFGLPSQAPKLTPGTRRTVVVASDYQEAKNIDTVGSNLYPNTAFRRTKLKVVDGPAVSWIEPPANVCALKHDRLTVVAGSTTKVMSASFSDGSHTIGTDKSGPGGVFSVAWNTSSLAKGKHLLSVTVVDRSGRKAASGRLIRVCK